MTANSAYLYTDVPVKTGNGYIYPISSFIYPFDYESFPNGLYANIDWVLGVTIRVNGLGGSE